MTVAVIAYDADELANATSAVLEGHDIDVVRIAPPTLADQAVTVSADTFHLGQRPINGILFRASTDGPYSQSFVRTDRNFSDTETKAVWLAAMHLPGMAVVNRYDAEAWFGGEGWVRWRRPFLQQGLPVAPFSFGSARDNRPSAPQWYPYSSGLAQPAPGRVAGALLGAPLSAATPHQSTMVVCGRVLGAAGPPAVAEAAAILQHSGIQLASIVTDDQGRILLVDSQPSLHDEAVVEGAAQGLGAYFHEHLRRR